MKTRFILALIGLSPIAGCSDASLLEVSVRSEAISHGQIDHNVQMVVAIEYDEHAIECSGTLISNTNVLTAAHCLAGVDASQLSVIAGADAQYPVPVSALHIHPDFDLESLTADLGVLELAEPLTSVPPLPVAMADILEEGSDALIVGFGVTTEADDMIARERRSGSASISAVGDETFELSAAPALPCNGDSGGAVIVPVAGRPTLFGVISHGDPQCSSGAVAMRTDAFAGFIEPWLATATAAAPHACSMSPERTRSAPRWSLASLLAVLACCSRRLGARVHAPGKRGYARARSGA